MATEYLDILNEDGRPTGDSATREEVHARGYWHGTAQMLLMNSSGDILVHRRAKNKKYYPEMLDIYFGGHVLSGETSKDALIREVKEEIGLSLNMGDFVFLFDIKKADVQNYGNFINNDFAQVYLVKTDFELHDLIFQKEEIESAEFFSQGKLKKEIIEDLGDFIPREKEYGLLFNALSI